MAQLGVCSLVSSLVFAACLDEAGGRGAHIMDEEADPIGEPEADAVAETEADAIAESEADAIAESEADAPADTAIASPEVHEVATDDASDVGFDSGADAAATCPEMCSARRPLILVHGINGSPANFDVMAARLVADGWPEDWVVRFAAADPAWGCNVDNAAALAALVEEVRQATCQTRVDIVAHSMGTLSSRHYIKNLGGAERVNTYVTLGGMHHGLLSPCFAPDFLGVCVWKELCQWGELITQLNADPATPGSLHWVSIYGTADGTVSNESSHLEGAENIVIEGAEHDGENGLLQRADAYAEVLRVLGYPCW